MSEHEFVKQLQLMAAIVNSSSEAIIAKDQAGLILTWNPAAERLFGYAAEEVIGRHVSILSNSTFPAPVLTEPSVHVYETVRQHKNGERIAISLTISPIFDSESHVVGDSEIVRTLASTEALKSPQKTQKRAGLDAHVAAKSFPVDIESCPVGMIIVRSDGCIDLVNAEAEKLFGYTRQELLGQPVEMLIPKPFRENHRDHRLGFVAASVERRMAAGRELFGLRKDGREVAIEVGLSSIGSQGQDYVLATVTDVTAHKQSEEKFRAIVESAPTALVMVDQRGAIALVNSQTERLFGYQRNELLGQPMELLLPKSFRSSHPAHRDQFFANPSVLLLGKERDLAGLHKDGSEILVEIGLNPLNSSLGMFVLASIVDITERKNSEKNLKRALEEKIVLLKEVHHRVKNNLQIISSLLALQAGNLGEGEAAEKLNEMQRRVGSMALVHEQLYQHEAMDSVDFAAYIQELSSEMFSSNSGHPLITCSLDLTSVALSVEQSIPCGMILNELILNSMKYAYPDGQGEIFIRLRDQGNSIDITVSDQGVGMPKGFDPKRSQSLGMTIVTALTQQLNGDFEIVSPPGTSSTVRFKR